VGKGVNVVLRPAPIHRLWEGPRRPSPADDEPQLKQLRPLLRMLRMPAHRIRQLSTPTSVGLQLTIRVEPVRRGVSVGLDLIVPTTPIGHPSVAVSLV
jgi:hypothetical protein